jgi:predicted phosphodiesterase
VHAHRVFSRLAELYPGAPLLITGDITDSGERDQMENARLLFDPLARTNPVLPVAGNHDYAWHGIQHAEESWKHWEELLGAPLGWSNAPSGRAPRWTSARESAAGVDGLGIWPDPDGTCVYFGVDSGDPQDRVRTARGYVSPKLAEKLHQQLEAHSGKTRIVMLHHHPFDEGYFMKLEGADALLSAIQGRCEVLLFGHDHHLGVWRNRQGTALMVASHKTTDLVFDQHLMVNVIEVENPTHPSRTFRHRLEIA